MDYMFHPSFCSSEYRSHKRIRVLDLNNVLLTDIPFETFGFTYVFDFSPS